MQSPEFFEKLARSLKDHGVTSQASRQLAAEFEDHYQCGLQERMRHGMSSREAELATVASLGDPDYLAEAAANKWRAWLWSNRHPWLFGLVNGTGAYLLALLIVVTTAYTADFLRAEGGWLTPHSPKVTLIVALGALCNWLPPLAGGLWMGWGYRMRRFQLKTFWIGCMGVALGASLFCVEIVAPTVEHHGSLTVYLGPLSVLLAWMLASLYDGMSHLSGGETTAMRLGYGSWKPLLGSATMWLQLLLTFVFAWAINAIRPALQSRKIRN